MFHLLLYSIALCLCSSYYLTFTQKQYITNILQHPDSSPFIKNKVKQVLISKYSYWAMKQANVFRKKYHMQNNYVSNSELVQSCLLGLVKSMKHYDGRVSVPCYANKYVQGELYKAFTRKHIGGRFTHYELMHLKKKVSNHTQVELYQQRKPHTVIMKSNLGMSEYEHKTFILYIREFLNNIRPIDRYIFLLRYDIFSGQVIRKHKDIGKLVCLSYKSVQKSIRQTQHKFTLYDKLQHIHM
jgi:hypothetical protein